MTAAAAPPGLSETPPVTLPDTDLTVRAARPVADRPRDHDPFASPAPEARA